MCHIQCKLFLTWDAFISPLPARQKDTACCIRLQNWLLRGHPLLVRVPEERTTAWNALTKQSAVHCQLLTSFRDMIIVLGIRPLIQGTVAAWNNLGNYLFVFLQHQRLSPCTVFCPQIKSDDTEYCWVTSMSKQVEGGPDTRIRGTRSIAAEKDCPNMQACQILTKQTWLPERCCLASNHINLWVDSEVVQWTSAREPGWCTSWWAILLLCVYFIGGWMLTPLVHLICGPLS